MPMIGVTCTYLGVANTVDGWCHDVFGELAGQFRAVVSSR